MPYMLAVTPTVTASLGNRDGRDQGSVMKRLSRKVMMLARRSKTVAEDRYAIGGRLKTRHAKRPVTLPKLKCLERES